MKTIQRNTKRLDKLETHDLKLSDGKNIRVIRDLETNQIELILDHDLLAKCNQGVKAEKKLDQEYQPYVLVEGFYNG
jgi:hypothetical protein